MCQKLHLESTSIILSVICLSTVSQTVIFPLFSKKGTLSTSYMKLVQ